MQQGGCKGGGEEERSCGGRKGEEGRKADENDANVELVLSKSEYTLKM